MFTFNIAELMVRFPQAVVCLTHVWEVPGSSLGWGKNYCDLITPWLTNKQTNSGSRVVLENIIVTRFFYVTWKFIAAFTTAHHFFLSWLRSVQFMTLQPLPWRSILILSSHLLLGLPNGLLSSALLTKTPSTSLLSHVCATCHVHLIVLRLITWIFERLRSSLLVSQLYIFTD